MMNCEQLKEKIADYALGTLAEDEHAAFEQALAACPEMAGEYSNLWQPTVEALAFAVEPQQPAAELRQRILSVALADRSVATQSVRQLASSQQPAVRQAEPAWGERLRGLFLSPRLAWAAVVLLLLLNLGTVAWGIGQTSQVATTQTQMTAMSNQMATQEAKLTTANLAAATADAQYAALLGDKNIHSVALQVNTMKAPTASAMAYFVPDKNAVYVTINNFSTANMSGTGHCNLWLVEDGKATNLGPLDNSESGVSLMAHAPANLASYRTLVITWEGPALGKQPSDQMIAESTLN